MLRVLHEADSLSARTDAVNQAIWARNDGVYAAARDNPDQVTVAELDGWYVVEIFDDYVIVRSGRQLLSVPYTFNADGIAELGAPTPVEVTYVPVQVQESVEDALQQLIESSTAADEGVEWDVVLIRPGLSLSGIYYPSDVLRESIPKFEGVNVYMFDEEARGHKKNAFDKAPRNLVGWINDVRQESDGRLVGRLHFLQEGLARTTRSNILSAWKKGKKNLFGLSIDARGLVKPAKVDGKDVQMVTNIAAALSVDIVLRPAAGGAFTQLVASVAGSTNPQEAMMDTKTKRLLRVLEARRPDALAGLNRENVEFVQLVGVANDAELQEAFTPEPVASATTSTNATEAATALQEARAIGTNILVRDMVGRSKLPELVQKRISKRFEGQVASEQQIQEAIDEERAYAASLAPARVSGLGGAREGAGVTAGAGRLEKIQAGLERSFGLETTDPALKNIKPLTLRQLYNEITFGGDPEVSGKLHESVVEQMLQEAFTSATLPEVMANVMGRKLLKDYNALDYGERRIITVVSANDFRQREAIRVGYFGDIATVDPEAADYAELAAYGDEQALYTVGQKGNLVTITRKHIINDDIGAVAKVVGRLGRAAKRTFARFVWNFPKNNANIYDGSAYFVGGHNNLQTVALSIAELNSAEQKLFNQTELSSAEKLGLTPMLLVVPIELKAVALTINQSPFLTGTPNNDANPWYHRFGVNNENIIVNPLLTDANDWYLFADINDADIIEVAFLNGQQEPEMFVADSPTVGQMFVADKLQYKIRHEYGGAVTDFRSAVKAVVP